MNKPLDQHQLEILRNKKAWESKPVLREVYLQFCQKIESLVHRALKGPVVEIGSGMGQLKTVLPEAICTDLFPNPWLDLVCDGYDLPFQNSSISNLILFDVFHHLERPWAFLGEAHRVMQTGGRVILFEPYISMVGLVAYGLAHHEPVGWNQAIDLSRDKPTGTKYYAAQGNATRLFFRDEAAVPPGWELIHREAFASFAYLCSGGFSKPACYPRSMLRPLGAVDAFLSILPNLFAARCLIVLKKVGMPG